MSELYTCTLCGHKKPFSEMSARAKGVKKASWCKDCKNAKLRQHKRTEKYKSYRREMDRLRRGGDQKKLRSRRRAYHALETGKILPDACEICDSVDDLQMHHDDYDQPLVVRWFCRKHHVELHQRNEE